MSQFFKNVGAYDIRATMMKLLFQLNIGLISVTLLLWSRSIVSSVTEHQPLGITIYSSMGHK